MTAARRPARSSPNLRYTATGTARRGRAHWIASARVISVDAVGRMPRSSQEASGGDHGAGVRARWLAAGARGGGVDGRAVHRRAVEEGAAQHGGGERRRGEIGV